VKHVTRPRKPGFQGNRPLQALTAAYALVWLVLAIAPKYWNDWLLENLLVFLFVGLLAATYRRFQFSNRSYALIALFLTLHAYGAHYTYSETPLGFWLRDAFDLGRNHYDRIVHFAFGLLLGHPMLELVRRLLRLRGIWAFLVAFFLMLSMSAGYESIESWVARIVSPELGTAYLGTQGDEWDAQRDMDRAMTGAVSSLALTWLGERWRARSKRRKEKG
jgi:putative membrane protein